MTVTNYVKPTRSKPSTVKRPASRVSKKMIAIVGAAVVVLAAIYWNSTRSEAGRFRFEVGDPGPGEMAPPILLGSQATGTFDLAAQRGKTVLLYFQEGLMCQPCWDQIEDIEGNLDEFRALGINQIVSITTDPAELLQQKRAADGIKTPVYSDPDLSVSRSYSTNMYGMMGESRNGHSFILVGPNGRIQWRADYGGAPDYTMFLPAANLVADIRRGLGKE